MKQKPAFQTHVRLALVFFALLAAPALPQDQGAGQKEDPASPAARQEAGATTEPATRTLNLSNPRATMQEFLLAMQDVDGGTAQRITDAVACLDISGLPGDDPLEKARLLARRLHTVIQAHGVKLSDIPEDPEGDTYTFLKLETPEGHETEPVIRLQQVEPETWKFTADTLAAIPALEAAVVALKEPQPDKAAPDVPAARRSARATMATFLGAMNSDPPDFAAAVLCLDPTGQNQDAWAVLARDYATKLKSVMDKTKVVVLSEIPDDPNTPPYEFYLHEKGNIVLARVEEVTDDLQEAFNITRGEWRFTPGTIEDIPALYAEFESAPILEQLREAGVQERLPLSLRIQRKMPSFLRWNIYGFEGWNLLGLLLTLLAGWIVKYIGVLVATPIGGLILRAKKFDIDRKVQRKAFRSFGAVAMTAFWWWVIQENYLQLPSWLLVVLVPLTTFGLGAAIGWFGYRVVDVLGGYIAASEHIRLTQFDEVLIPLLRTVLRMAVIVVVILFVLNLMGWRPTTVLGALGIGGLAIAFAAKDALANFFGSITVLLDRPFSIGDWIEVDGTHGTVEQVGFRSTRLRTFYNSMVTIPNSTMVNKRVDNYGARRYRRTSTTLGITYNTPPDKIDAFTEGIRELIRLHPYTRKDYYHVYMSGFADSAFEVMLYVFFQVPDWATELRERHRLYIDIIKLADKLGIEFAFPTRTVWLNQIAESAAAGETAPAGTADPQMLGADQAARVFREAYGESPEARMPVVIERKPRSAGGDGDQKK